MTQNIEDSEITNKKSKKTLYMAVFLICIAVAVGSIVILVGSGINLNKQTDVYESLQSEQTQHKVESEIQTEPAISTEPSEELMPLEDAMTRIIDFKGLQQDTNSDIYAWIYIPDTNVDYPVLQHPTDDYYYLDYNIDGTKGYPGCIYTERENSKDFSDFNTILYGHNMKNGTMFHDLHNYKDELYMKEHPYLYIYLPDKTLKYEIFSAYQYDDRHILYSFDFSSEQVRKGYLEDIFKIKNMSAVFNNDAEVESDSQIITMSTCVGGQSLKRFLVQAVLINDINE